MSQVEKLRQAGCVRAEYLEEGLAKKIECLSDIEVKTLIEIRNKLKPDDGQQEICPDVF